MHRRSFLVGLSSLFVAPAIVKAGVLMPIKPLYDFGPNAEKNILAKLERMRSKGLINEFSFTNTGLIIERTIWCGFDLFKAITQIQVTSFCEPHSPLSTGQTSRRTISPRWDKLESAYETIERVETRLQEHPLPFPDIRIFPGKCLDVEYNVLRRDLCYREIHDRR